MPSASRWTICCRPPIRGPRRRKLRRWVVGRRRRGSPRRRRRIRRGGGPARSRTGRSSGRNASGARVPPRSGLTMSRRWWSVPSLGLWGDQWFELLDQLGKRLTCGVPKNSKMDFCRISNRRICMQSITPTRNLRPWDIWVFCSGLPADPQRCFRNDFHCLQNRILMQATMFELFLCQRVSEFSRILRRDRHIQ